MSRSTFVQTPCTDGRTAESILRPSFACSFCVILDTDGPFGSFSFQELLCSACELWPALLGSLRTLVKQHALKCVLSVEEIVLRCPQQLFD